jgi:hypothetical protein
MSGSNYRGLVWILSIALLWPVCLRGQVDTSASVWDSTTFRFAAVADYFREHGQSLPEFRTTCRNRWKHCKACKQSSSVKVSPFIEHFAVSNFQEAESLKVERFPRYKDPALAAVAARDTLTGACLHLYFMKPLASVIFVEVGCDCPGKGRISAYEAEYAFARTRTYVRYMFTFGRDGILRIKSAVVQYM